MTFRLLDGETRADGQDSAGDADARDDQERNQIRDADIMRGGDKEAGDGAKNFHDNQDEENLIDDRDEAGEEGLMQKHGIQDVVNEVDADGSSHDQKKNRHVAVSDNLAFGDQTEKGGAKAGWVGFQHAPQCDEEIGESK